MTDSTLATTVETTVTPASVDPGTIQPTPVHLLPDLVEIQRASFRWFLSEGLVEELESFSPITDYTGKLELHFLGKDYRLKAPKYMVD